MTIWHLTGIDLRTLGGDGNGRTHSFKQRK